MAPAEQFHRWIRNHRYFQHKPEWISDAAKHLKDKVPDMVKQAFPQAAGKIGGSAKRMREPWVVEEKQVLLARQTLLMHLHEWVALHQIKTGGVEK